MRASLVRIVPRTPFPSTIRSKYTSAPLRMSDLLSVEGFAQQSQSIPVQGTSLMDSGFSFDFPSEVFGEGGLTLAVGGDKARVAINCG